MTGDQRELVRQTFDQIAPIADQAAELFYGRLFDIDPATRVLFRGDMKQQGKKVMQVLGYCVSRLDHTETLSATLHDLGRRHARYGVPADSYDTVGAALLWTLEQGLGAAFTPAARDAWGCLYQDLAGSMKEGARAAETD